MASRNRTLQFAVTGSLLALAPVGPVDSCVSIADPPMAAGDLASEAAEPPSRLHPDHEPEPWERFRAEEGGPVVNPGPVPSGE
jgi:hypothetical protein